MGYTICKIEISQDLSTSSKVCAGSRVKYAFSGFRNKILTILSTAKKVGWLLV